MACMIIFKEQSVHLNNMQFAGLIDFGIEIAERLSKAEDRLFIDHMKKMRNEVFFPGRGILIAEDFPALDEQKFWSCMFYEVSRAIFDKKIGVHVHSFWASTSYSSGARNRTNI
jgi:hypothetical protein